MSVAVETETSAFLQELTKIQKDVKINLSTLSATIGTVSIHAESILELRSKIAATIYSQFHIRNSLIEHSPAINIQDLQKQLIADIPHRFVIQRAKIVPSHKSYRDIIFVELSGVIVAIATDQTQSCGHEGYLDVMAPSWRRQTTPGYLLALGQKPITVPAEAISRIYLSCETAEDMLFLWPQLLKELNSLNIGYQAKALSSTASYPRADALVIYCAGQDLPQILTCTKRIKNSINELNYSPTSLFSQEHSSGISTAEEPKDFRPAYQELSFGQHRSKVLTDALLLSAQQLTSLEKVWFEEAQVAGIDPVQPAYNSLGIQKQQ